MSYPWTDIRLTLAWAAAQGGCECAGCVDVISLVAEVRRLRANLDIAIGALRLMASDGSDEAEITLRQMGIEG